MGREPYVTGDHMWVRGESRVGPLGGKHSKKTKETLKQQTTQSGVTAVLKGKGSFRKEQLNLQRVPKRGP